MERPAWRTLSVGARALLIELKSLYHGTNNGALYLAVREAARRLSSIDRPVGKTIISDWFWELQDRGWIRPKVPTGFNQKAAARERLATCWILTEYPMPGGVPPSREFTTWAGPPKPRPKIIRRSAEKDSLSLSPDSLSLSPDSLSLSPDSPSESVRPQGQICADAVSGHRALSSSPDTDIYHVRGANEPRGAEPSEAQRSAADALRAMQMARLKQAQR